MPKIIDAKPGSISGGTTWSGKKYQKTFSMVYTVLGDNTTQTEDDILNTIGLPALGVIVRGCYFKSAKAKEIDTHALLWEVDCSFDSELQLDSQTSDTPDPLDLTPDWSWSSEPVQQLIDCDQVTGLPIVTKAGEKILIDSDFAIPVLTIVRYQAYFDPDTILAFENTTNSTTFWGAPPGVALMGEIRDKRTVVQTVPLREVTYSIKFNFLMAPVIPSGGGSPIFELVGWKSAPLHQGTYYKASTGEKISFLDENGKPRIGNLDIDGDDNGDADPVYLNFNRYRQTNFNLLSLGPW
jgi:hypothetical protein